MPAGLLRLWFSAVHRRAWMVVPPALAVYRRAWMVGHTGDRHGADTPRGDMPVKNFRTGSQPACAIPAGLLRLWFSAWVVVPLFSLCHGERPPGREAISPTDGEKEALPCACRSGGCFGCSPLMYAGQVLLAIYMHPHDILPLRFARGATIIAPLYMRRKEKYHGKCYL